MKKLLKSCKGQSVTKEIVSRSNSMMKYSKNKQTSLSRRSLKFFFPEYGIIDSRAILESR